MNKRSAYLFVVPWPVTGVGGVNQVVLNLYHHFEAGGVYTPKIFVTSWDHHLPLTADENGRAVSYMRLRSPLGSGPFAAVVKSAVFLPFEVLRLARYLRANDIAIVNVHYPSLSALNFILVRFFRRRPLRVILSFHGLELAHALRTTGLERWMWGLMLRTANAVVGCSNAERDLILALEPAIRRRVTTIRNGVDIDRLMRARNLAARIDPRLGGRPFILTVASYEHKKGLDTLLRAFKYVRDAGNVDVMLALAGADCGSGPELRNLARQLGISNDVVFCGTVPHEDLHAYYEAASIFCLPSRMEPFGIVLVEAGAFRCAVVATSVGGIPEILSDGINACLVPPDDPRALAAQLRRLLSDGKERDRLASSLFERVRAHFPWRRAYESYLQLCERAPFPEMESLQYRRRTAPKR